MACMDKNVEKAKQVKLRNWRVVLRELAEELDMSHKNLEALREESNLL